MTIKNIRVQGEILKPGEMFRTQNAQLLIDQGYARKLTRDERKDILNEYVRIAEKVIQYENVRLPDYRRKRFQTGE
ncbi:MAG: hypothetical protein NTU69_12435 [Proteobacteria bacterium]|nr:hypothetical protein [Pseudomonadota bacterium]